MRGLSYTIDAPKAEEFSQMQADVTSLIIKVYHVLPLIPTDKKFSLNLKW